MRSFLITTLALAAAPLHLAAGVAVASASASDVAAYEAFRQKYGRSASKGADSVSYEERLALFLKRKAEVDAHNSRPGALWKATVNQFADYTPEEHSAMLGYRRLGRWWEGRDFSGSAAGRSFLELRPAKLADSIDYRRSLNSSQFLRQQGACGSCWAVAAVGALEMHAEIRHQSPRKLSFQQLVDCVPNPQHCGGDGGCKGATAELAFQYVQDHGLADVASYVNSHGACSQPKVATSIKGWERLPTNKLQPLLEAVANKGPVVVSVDASSWSMYDSGVFNGCGKDATVNHAVLLVGYGTDNVSGKKYWLIRNSWGADWGEAGFIRLQRHDSDEGDAGHCGTDRDPKQGVGCDGGPSQIPVCGMCGILSDSSYPKEVEITPANPAASLLDETDYDDLENAEDDGEDEDI